LLDRSNIVVLLKKEAIYVIIIYFAPKRYRQIRGSTIFRLTQTTPPAFDDQVGVFETSPVSAQVGASVSFQISHDYLRDAAHRARESSFSRLVSVEPTWQGRVHAEPVMRKAYIEMEV
jgi:hypothetical protein